MLGVVNPENISPNPYRPRVIDGVLRDALKLSGAVVIEGARACGKTATALNAAQSYAFLDDQEVQQILQISPQAVLEGATPRLLDEWQIAPQLWNLVRRAVDADPKPGKYILTGSALPADDITRHTGAGRFVRVRQRTMSWYEKLEPPANVVSISALFSGQVPKADLTVASSLKDVIDGVLTSGFPAMTPLNHAQSAIRLRGYLDDVVRTDLPRLAEIRNDSTTLKQLITALARSVASDVQYKTLAADVRAVAPRITEETVSTYVGLLERLFLVEAQLPWSPTLRSRARIRTAPKLHLVDPSFAAAVLGASEDHLAKDLSTLGLLFESAVFHDLTVLSAPLEGQVRHYRDSNGKEIDAVIELPDGRWAAVEVKLGGAQFAAGAQSLSSVVAQVDTGAMGEPAFRLVVTGTGPVLTADDGTIAAPLRYLAP